MSPTSAADQNEAQRTDDPSPGEDSRTQTEPRRRLRIGRWILLAIVLLFGLPVGLVAYQYLTARHMTIKISKETTYVTEHLTARGLPDYVAALNARMGAGVTPETNTAVKLWEAVGPLAGLHSAEFYAAMAAELGMAPLPKQGDYLIDFIEWLSELLDSRAELNGSASQPIAIPPSVFDFPWRTAECPDLVAWFERNEVPLQRVHEGMQLPQYFQPLVPTKASSEIGAPLRDVEHYHVFQLRKLAELLTARAMWHLGEGRVEQAMQDLLDCHRLARKVTQGWTAMELIIAEEIESKAAAGTFALIVDPQLNIDQARVFREQLELLGPVITHEKLAEIVDQGERLLALNMGIALANGSISVDRLVISDELTLEHRARFIETFGVDGNLLLQEINQAFDQRVEAMLLPDRESRSNELARLRDENEYMMNDLFLSLKTPYCYLLLGGKPARGRALAKIIIHSLEPIHEGHLIDIDRGTIRWQTKLVGLALVEYRLTHGRYPAELEVLIPDYLQELPVDVFSGDPLQYTVSADGREMKVYSIGPNQVDNAGMRYNDWNAFERGVDDIGVVDPIPQRPVGR